VRIVLDPVCQMPRRSAPSRRGAARRWS